MLLEVLKDNEKTKIDIKKLNLISLQKLWGS